MADTRHIKPIDGLRGLSILLVILCHLDVPWFRGGFVGVDVFFVISGFVITNSLDKRLCDPDVIRAFYERRIRRLLPSLTLVAAACCAVFPFIKDSIDQSNLVRTAGWAIMGLSNFYFSRSAGYFDDTAQENPLLHTWSLAVEEQFYILFAVLLVLIRLVWPREQAGIRSKLFWSVAAGTIISLACSVLLSHANARFSYFMLPCRFWEIGAGSLLFLLSGKIRLRAHPLLSLVGMALVIFSSAAFNDATPYPGYNALAPVAGALLLIAGSHGESLTNRLLSSRGMLFLGKISYALYLVHWPVIVFVQGYIVRDLTWIQMVAITAFSVALAAALTFLLEIPIQQKKFLAARKSIWSFGAVAALAAVMIVVLKHEAVHARAPGHLQSIAGINDADMQSMTPSMLPGGASFVPIAQIPVIGAHPENITAVWGDSHALDLVFNLGPRLARHDLSYKFFICWNTLPIVGLESSAENARHQGEVIDELIHDPSIKNVVLNANWTGYLEGGKYFGHRFGDEPMFQYRGSSVARKNARAVFEAQLDETLQRLTSAGKNVFLCTPIPVYSFDVNAGVEKLKKQGRDPNSELTWSLRQFSDINKDILDIFNAASKRIPRVYVIPIHRAFFADGRSIVEKNGASLYNDAHHMSAAGADLLDDLIPDAIDAAGK